MGYFNNLIVGGTAKFLQDVKIAGLDSTMEELNYLHKEAVTKEGWIIPEEGTVAVESLYGAQGVIGFKIGNTYTFTITYKDGTIETDNVIAIDSADWDYSAGAVILQCGDLIIVDKANIDSEFNITVGTNYYWYPPSVVNDEIETVLVTGTKFDGSALTRTEETYNKIPFEHLELAPVIEQYYEWTSSDVIPVKGQVTVIGELLTFMRPDPSYNRCEIITRWKEINRSDLFDEYVSPSTLMLVPYDSNGEVASTEGVYTTGNANDSVYLGTGDETTTTAYNEWYITEQYTVLFDKKGIFVRQIAMAAPDEEGTTKTITETKDHPAYAICSYAYGLDRNADTNPFIGGNIEWGFLTSVRKTKGSYIQLKWYQD